MAKPDKKTREANAIKARYKLIRYIAITNICDYDAVGDYSISVGYRRMDATECTAYYLDKGWMIGVPLKNSGNYLHHCKLDAMRQCAIIAYTSSTELDSILNGAKESSCRSYFHRWHESNEAFGILVKALNTFCRAYPEVLDVFGDMEDFPKDIPNNEETQLLKDEWEITKKKLYSWKPTLDNIMFLAPLMLHHVFKEFYQSLPLEIFVPLFDYHTMGYKDLTFLNNEEYNYFLDLTAHDDKDVPLFFLDQLHDDLIFYQHFLLHGDIASHKKMMYGNSLGMLFLSAIDLLQKNKPDDAVNLMIAYFKGKENVIFNNPIGDFLYGLALYQSKSEISVKKASALLRRKAVKDNNACPYFKLFIQMKLFPETDLKEWVKYNNCSSTTYLGAAFYSLLCTHYGYSKAYKDTAARYAKILIDNKVKVLALDFARDMSEQYVGVAEQFQEQTGMKPFLPEFKILEPWEEVLNVLMTKYDTDSSKSGSSKSKKKKASRMEMSRVSYLLDTYYYNVQPRLQKSKDGGATWSGGRNIALKNFRTGIPEMTPQDARVAMHVQEYSYGWYGGTEITLGGEDVVEALIGHPLVFDSHNSDIKLEIQAEKLQIQVKEESNGYKVSYNIPSGNYNSVVIIHENVQLIKVVHLSKEEKDMMKLFDRIGTFPKKAKEQLTKLLTAIGQKVTVMSPLLKNAENVKQKKGDTKLTVQLVPYGDMFTVRCFVKPLVTCPPYCQPGKGLEFIATNVDGKMVQVARNLSAEKKNYKTFTEWMEPYDEFEMEDSWQMPIESCLEVLDLLRQHQDLCMIEWPEGVKFSITRPMLSADKLNLSVKGMGHWFEVDGEIKIDEKEQMKVGELLKRVRQAKGRFIQIGDDEYIALSQQLQKQLAALDRMMQTDRKQLKIATYNSSFLKDLADAGASVKADKKYTEMMQKMDEADAMKISVPKTLQADLRDYQKDGYRWLCRLAHWGAGACLADDMGLGKTIQTIALLLSRAKEGASLVVMPTSVLINWKNELERFAPSLNPVILRDASDRAEAVKNAGAQDVVLLTYGLLPTEEETLKSKQWNVIVLDEAHTIKNKETKTSKAAMQLDGQFRLLLTGTPLQNHLSEIWNLFQFATPGLLTGYTQFTEEFINPIEKDHNKEPQRLLKRMLQPFILRRTKSEVLNELPEKTEITLKVELSDAERALYDRFREEAVLNLEEGSTSAIKALAELTKLRQTACNAALVLPAKEAKAIPSSKMEAFLKLVEELMRNHHRALVFSQFTSHLALVEKELKRLKIDYQYLDGSVSPTERLARVADFQKGDMPLFLISLKAGGTGLNLTAADYVIHLDPWWNPAIEDQASDRAYRIGQDKPVTVYRLIAENTIEEKIIALHKSKKSLADALLEGSDMAYALGKDEILNLIRGIE